MLAIPVLIAICLALVPSGSNAADEVHLYIDPPQSLVGPGEVFQVDLVAVPPDGSLVVWIVRVHFDPTVIAFDDCDPLGAPPGYAFVAACELVVIGPSQAVVSIGAAIDPNTSLGLTSTSSLATITYEALGNVGDFSDLEIEVVAMFGPDPNSGELDTVINDGYVEIEAPPPVGGSVELTVGAPEPSVSHVSVALLVAAAAVASTLVVSRLTWRRRP